MFTKHDYRTLQLIYAIVLRAMFFSLEMYDKTFLIKHDKTWIQSL